MAMDVAVKAYNLIIEHGRENIPEYSIVLGNLGMMYVVLGNYSQAEPLYKEALEIIRSTGNEAGPDLAHALNNLGGLYYEIGDYSLAKGLYEEAVEVSRKSSNVNPSNLAHYLTELAGLRVAFQEYSKAEPLYKEALEIIRSSVGERHPDYSETLGALARTHSLSGNYSRAELLGKKAVETDRMANRRKDRAYAINLHYLANTYFDTGRYSEAQPFYEEAVEVKQSTSGDNHPYLGDDLLHLAIICAINGRKNDTMEYLKRIITIDDNTIGEVFSISSERQRGEYIRILQSHFDGILSLVLTYFSESPDFVQLAFNLVQKRKALNAEASSAVRNTVLGNKYPHLKPKLQELDRLRELIGQKTLFGPSYEGFSNYKDTLDSLLWSKDILERNLSREINEMRQSPITESVSRQAISNSLSKDDALIEFVRIQVLDYASVSSKENTRSIEQYAAFVLIGQQPDNIDLFNLGDANSIDHLVNSFKDLISRLDENKNEDDTLSLRLKSSASNGFSVSINDVQNDRNMENGPHLLKAIFDPILAAIGNRKRLFLCPDGDLTMLPFEALPTHENNDHHLVDDYVISYLNVARDILRFNIRSNSSITDALVVCDPDFDLGSSSPNVLSVSVEQQSSEIKLKEIRSGIHHFKTLRGTRLEGKEIASLLGVKPLSYDKAVESHVKACSPRILHIATHGYFLPDKSRQINNKGSKSISRNDNLAFNRLERKLDNPLLRSGLALAGANTWIKGGSLPEEAEDGLLTAEDISGMDLSNTELVVLSACDTGLGEVHRGEGVFGLRRAFTLAGAQTVVMSLWKVKDEQTKELMVEFYNTMFLAGKSRAEAFRESQLVIKRKYKKPYYWASFICQGNPGSLSHLGKYEEAIKYHDTAKDTDPNSSLLRDAELLFKHKNLLDLEPNRLYYVLIWASKGGEQLSQKKFKEAIECFDKALELEPKYSPSWIGKGVALGQLEKHNEAIKCFDRAVQLAPNYSEAWSKRGHLYLDLNNFEEASKSFDKAIELEPNNAEAWSGKGSVAANIKGYEEALKYFDKASELRADVGICTLRGYALAQLGRFEEAIECYDKAIECYDTSDNMYADLTRPYLCKAQALAQLGRYQEAIECYDIVTRMNPADYSTWYDKGDALFRWGEAQDILGDYNESVEQHDVAKQKYEEAIECYDIAAQINPNVSNVWLNKGHALEKVNRLIEAIECYDKAIELNGGKSGETYYWKALCLSNLGRYQEAIDCYDKALEQDPLGYSYIYRKGFCLSNLGRYQEAIDCYDKALELQPDLGSAGWSSLEEIYPLTVYKGRCLSNLGRYQEAIDCYDKALESFRFEHNPMIATILNYKGTAFLYLNKYREAIDCYDKALELDSKDVDVLYNKGILLYNLNRYQEALDCYDKAIVLNPNDPALLKGKGFALYNLNRYQEAIDCYDKVLEITPDDTGTLTFQGRSLFELGRYEEANEVFDITLNIDPNNSAIWAAKGSILNHLQKYNEALKCFSKVLELDPDHAEGWNKKGVALTGLGKYDEALQCFERSLELDPTKDIVFRNRIYALNRLKQSTGQKGPGNQDKNKNSPKKWTQLFSRFK